MAGAMLTIGISDVWGGGSMGCVPKPTSGGVSAQATNTTVNILNSGIIRFIRFSSRDA
jgi:hypothetical protein